MAESRSSQIESQSSQIESRSSQIESRSSQIESRSSQIDGQIESQSSQSTPLLGSVITHQFSKLEEEDDNLTALRDIFLAGLKTLKFPREVRRELSIKSSRLGFMYVVGHPQPDQCSIILKQFDTDGPRIVNLKRQILVEVIYANKRLRKDSEECFSFWCSFSRSVFKDFVEEKEKIDFSNCFTSYESESF